MRPLIVLLAAILIFVAAFVRSFTTPPAPDRQGGTTVMVTWPDRAVFGSPRGACLNQPETDPVIPCLVSALSRARSDGLMRVELPFCATCYDLSQRIALLGADETAVRAKQAQIARFGW